MADKSYVDQAKDAVSAAGERLDDRSSTSELDYALWFPSTKPAKYVLCFCR